MDRSKWEYKKLGDICDKGSSNIAQNKIEDNTGDYALYGASGYVKGIDFYHQEQPYIGVVKDGSGVGRVNKYPAKSSLLGTMQYIFPKECCDLGYLLYVLQGLHLEKYKTGAAIPHIYFKDYCKCEVPFPSIADQQRIVAELDCLNEMIAVKQEQLKEFDKLAQSIFYDMFGDPVSNEKGWTTTTLGEHFVFSQGLQVPTDLQYLEDGNNRKRFLRIIDFTQGNEPARYIEEDSEKYYLHSNEIALVRYGTPGFVCMGKEGVIANNLFKITSQYSDVNNWFLYFFLNSDAFQKPISANQYGATMKAISFGSIKKIPFILPPLSLQQQFADKISAIEAQKELVKQSIAETQALLDYSMDYYFNE